MPIDSKDLIPSLWDVQAKPSPTNTWPLGSPSLAWSNLYLGPNGAPAFDPTTGNLGYYERTAAEISAGVTPTAKVFPPGCFERFGADPTGVADSSTAITNAVKVGGYVYAWTMTGTFYYKEVALINSVRIDFRGATSKLVPTSPPHASTHAFFIGTNNTDVVIENGIFDGNLSNQPADAGNTGFYQAIFLSGCDRCLVRFNHLKNTYGDSLIRLQDGSFVKVLGNTVESTTNNQDGIFYTSTNSRTNYDIALDWNETNGCGIALNDYLSTQQTYDWSISHNRIQASNTLNQVGIGARASNGIIIGNTVRGGYLGITANQGAAYNQHDLLIANNLVICTLGTFNFVGIEHYANEVTVANNTLVDCGITTSNSVGPLANITITGNHLKEIVTSVATDAAISFSTGTFTNVTVSGNTASGHGCFLSSGTPVNNLSVTGNNSNARLIASTSGFVVFKGAGATLSGLNVSGNNVANAQAGFVFISATSGTWTVDRMRLANNSLDSNSFGVGYFNTNFNTNYVITRSNDNPQQTQITYSASMTPDMIVNQQFAIFPSDAVAFTVNTPLNPAGGQIAYFEINNTQGVATGAATFGGSFRPLTNGFTVNAHSSTEIGFKYDSSNGVWKEISRISNVAN